MATRLREVMQAWRPTRPRLLPAERHRRVLAQAWMERHGGLTVLYLSGTPYEMGYQHGVLARDLIHGFRKAAYAYVATRIPGPGWLARSLLLHRAAAYWPTVPQEIAEEIRGIADGAGVHPVEVLAANGMWELPLASGCSGFAAVRPTTAYDSLLHGYNYDLMAPAHALIQPYLAVLFYQPDQGVPFFTANTVGSVGANAGM
ncbi:MAG TPA: hypothetical protein ENK56_08150, partial [Chloroflexi bacterium]|nr:hypothetical protein [Chloroflexota bacterium]